MQHHDTEVTDRKLPFGVDFQRALLRLLCEDSDFSRVVGGYLEPQYFANEMFAWMYSVMRQHSDSYGGFPSSRVVLESVRNLDQKVRPMYDAAVSQMAATPLVDEQWMRDQTLEFVKKTIFIRTIQEVRTIFNNGDTDAAYDLTMERLEKIRQTSWKVADEEDYFDELPIRQNNRLNEDPSRHSIGTGFPSLDSILNGGLSKGELGAWIAYAKKGKSTMLVQHGVAATRLAMRNTAHFVFEGSRRQVADRYDANFLDEFYTNIRFGNCDANKYSVAWQQFQNMKGLLKLRGFTDEWDYSVLDIDSTLKEWKQQDGWVPDLIIVDYGDLLSGRAKNYPSETAKQQAAFRDLKTMANKGYAIWTASQAQRPAAGKEIEEHIIYSRQIADCYAKVRVCDFLGSINVTMNEFEQGVARIFAELYRDNSANQVIRIKAEFAKMKMYEPLDWAAEAAPLPPQDNHKGQSPHARTYGVNV